MGGQAREHDGFSSTHTIFAKLLWWAAEYAVSAAVQSR